VRRATHHPDPRGVIGLHIPRNSYFPRRVTHIPSDPYFHFVYKQSERERERESA